MKPQNKALPTVIVSAFMAEYDVLTPDAQELIKNWLMEFKLVGISNFFTNECQAILVKQIAENQFIRTFLLNHTERVHLLTLFAEDVDPGWMKTCIDAITLHRVYLSSNSVLPESVVESLYMPSAMVETLVLNNAWILDLYLILITDGVFDYTNALQDKTA